MQETQVQPLGWKDTLEKGMATHASILAWRIPWTEPGGLQSMSRKELDMTELLTKQQQQINTYTSIYIYIHNIL